MHVRTSLRRQALPLLSALAANAAAQAFLLVALPSLGRDLGFDPLETGLLLGSAALLLIIFAPLWGRVSERAGRRPVLLVGVVGAALAPALMAAVIGLRLDGMLERMPTLVLLFAVRAGQSILSAGLLPSAQAWMADRTLPESRAEGMGLLGASYGVGGIVGAGFAFAVGGTYPLAALAGLALLNLLGLCLVHAAIHDGPAVSGPKATPLARLDIPRIAPGLAITFMGVAVYAVMQHVTALRFEDGMGLSRQDAISKGGAALMGAAIIMALAQTFGISRFKFPPRRLILMGAAAGTLSLAGVTLATSPAMLLASLFLMGGALGILLPGNLAMISIRAGAGAQGRAAGINAVAQGLAMTVGPIAGAMLHRLSAMAPGILSTVAMLFALIICLRTREKP
ncbi:hypothetical protein ACO34A_26675 (plasmid) [Rhizobium sp. ACO-34A]|nr:MFS transporter [Rhizobium sp. ACO-34A]ATN37354.1 hypothetical protein ACO34A_26675 [Rhizobium sp. ACO-34A]